MDDAFRRQLESDQVAHQAELLRLGNEKQKQIEQANQRVKYRRFFTEMPSFPPSWMAEQVLCVFYLIHHVQ